MDHTGCHQLNRVLTHNNNVSEKCQPFSEVRLTMEAKGKGALAGMAEAAGEQDAALLQSQLAPHSTPQLRARLFGAFGTATDPEQVGREEVMRRLLECYAAAGARRVVGAVQVRIQFTHSA
jgi:hypothetical protein